MEEMTTAELLEEMERTKIKIKSSETLIKNLRSKLMDAERDSIKSNKSIARMEADIKAEKALTESLNKEKALIEERLKGTEDKLKSYIEGYSNAIELIQTLDATVPIIKHNAYLELADALKNNYKKNAALHKAIDRIVRKVDKLEND